MIKLAAPFSDDMVLQRQKPIRIWGVTDKKQRIRILLNGETLAEDEIRDDFSLFLPPQEAAEDAELTIEGEFDSLRFRQVDIGELWIAGGQSNMEFLLSNTRNPESEIASAGDEHLRFYDVGEYSYPGEKSESPKDGSFWDRWLTFKPENAGAFSAVGLYFAKELRRKYRVPVGILGCNWGGTSASCWLDESFLEKDLPLHVYLEEYENGLKKIDMASYPDFYREGQRALFGPPFSDIQKKIMAGTMTWVDQLRMIPLGIKLLRYTKVGGPYSETRPGGLYHMMLQQIAGMSTRGVIWYQGESDEQHASLYGRLFSHLVECWRRDWQEELPFLTVQLAPLGKWMMASGENFPEVRRQQTWAKNNIPGVSMICLMDDGDPKDIHPKNKKIVGERLALLASGKVYGEEGECESPEMESVSVAKGEVSIAFAHAKTLHIRGEQLQALSIFADGKKLKDWSWHTQGNRLVIRYPSIESFKTLRVSFAQEGYCQVNLYNQADLPAFPFVWES